MRKNLLLILVLFIPSMAFSQGQCLGGGCTSAGSQYPSLTQSTTSSTFVTISSCMFGGEYALCNVTSGVTYEWSLCTADGGTNTYDAQLTLFNNGTLGQLCYSDDFCGVQPKIQWTATFTGVVRVKVSQYNCTTNSSCTTLRWRASSSTPPPNPCTSATSISCATPVTANLTGSGAGWNITACGYSTPGQEAVYSFTPTVTGTYNIQVTSATGGFVDYFWQSGTCSPTGWNCIADIFSTGTYGSMTWTAGVTYYILLDPEGTSSYSHTFQVVCPTGGGGPVTASDCSNSSNACTNLTFSVDPSGSGAVNELCTSCTSNPSVNPVSLNSGCLISGELNSTWLVVNIATTGVLQFSFGVAGSTNFNCYDWIMWPYTPTTCTSILANTLAPVRCNWNSPCEEFTGIASTPPVGGSTGNFEPDLAVTAGQQYIICFSNYSSAVTSVPLNFFGSAAVSCTPLPVEMLSFTGQANTSHNQLEWVTASELNNHYFTVERSRDGRTFEPIGRVTGSGYSNTPLSYSFLDESPQAGVNYYRLKQTDFNGVEGYSDIIALTNEKAGSTAIFPNPVNDQLTVQVNNMWTGMVKVEITDLTGKRIISNDFSIQTGQNIRFQNLSYLKPGPYLVKLRNLETGEEEHKKILKY